MTAKLMKESDLSLQEFELSKKRLEREQLSVGDLNFDAFKKLQEVTLGVKKDVNYALEMADFHELLTCIRGIYATQKNYIPQDVKFLLKNAKFRSYVLKYISENISDILNNDSVYSFEEISFFVFLLGFGEYNDLLIDLNTYDFEKLDSLFEFYIENLVSSLSDTEGQNLCFDSFVLLLELMNKLAILNQTDSKRRSLIVKLSLILEDKIKKLISRLSEKKSLSLEKSNLLQHFLGKLLINFSHICYIETKGRSLNDILGDFLEIIEKQVSGYTISSASNFGNDSTKESTVRQTFLGNMAYVVSVMILKVKNFNPDEVLNNRIFKDIVNLFLSNLFDGKNKHEVDSLEELNSICNDVYISIYDVNQEKQDQLAKKRTGKEVLKDFISNKSKVNDFQMESIHHLVMFLPGLTLDEYLEIGNFLISIPKFNNYNFEFFKLKTLDVVISKIPSGYIDSKIQKFLDELAVYIENNKTASQLLHTYSRLCLSMAFYYSQFFDEDCQEKAMKYYFVFSETGGLSFDFERCGRDLDQLYYNFGLHRLNFVLCNFNDNQERFNLPKSLGFNLSRDQIVNFGKLEFDRFKESFEAKLRNNLDSTLSSLLENALNQESGVEDSEINRKVGEVLSSKIFHGIAEVCIVNVDSDKNFMKSVMLHNGISSFQIDLFDGYKLFFIFPRVYKGVFENIFNRENSYIVKNVRNIISGYLKRRDLYIDHNTGLSNELKLKDIISNQYLGSDIAFISIKLNVLKTINNGYGYEFGDEYIKKVAEALISINGLNRWNVFKLNGAKIGVIVKRDSNLEEIINAIKNIKFSVSGTEYKLDCFIGVVTGDNTVRVIDKSNVALDYAKETLDGVFYYSESVDSCSQNKELLEYLNKLDSAIEEDRIVLFVQPICCSGSRKVYKNEVLMRVRTKNGEFKNPDKYLLSAEKFGKLTLIFNIMLRKVFEYAYFNEGNFSINISGADLKNKNLLDYISEISSNYPIDPSRITFEILEGEWDESDQSIKNVQLLKEIGFKIAMDDFGAKDSNINRLLDLLKKGHIDYIKIDQKLIRALMDEDRVVAQIAKKLLKGIIEASHLAGVEIVAESVENEEIAKICESLGIDFLQGYYLGKPNALG